MKSLTEKLADLPWYTEGPVVDQGGNLFFTTLTGGKIMTLTAGIPSVWGESLCPNGQFIAVNGEHWVCDSRQGSVAVYSRDGSFIRNLVEKKCAGRDFTTPNDLIADSAGNLYFSESIRNNGKVFFIGTDGKEELVADGIDYANGLILSHDESILYVAESYGNRILALTLDQKRLVRNRQVLIQLPEHPSGDPLKNLPDGLGIDREGRIWVAHYGMGMLQVIAPEGELITSVETHLPLTSNLTFIEDTPGKKVLLVTGGYGEPGPGAVMKVTVYT